MNEKNWNYLKQKLYSDVNGELWEYLEFWNPDYQPERDENQKTHHLMKQTKLFLRICKTIEILEKKSNFSKHFNL